MTNYLDYQSPLSSKLARNYYYCTSQDLILFFSKTKVDKVINNEKNKPENKLICCDTPKS